MKHKLVIVFDDDSVINGINRVLIFNNLLDAESFFELEPFFKSVDIDVDNNQFSFTSNVWNGVWNGKCYWGTEVG